MNGEYHFSYEELHKTLKLQFAFLYLSYQGVKDSSKLRGIIFSINYSSKGHMISTVTPFQQAASGSVATSARFIYICANTIGLW